MEQLANHKTLEYMDSWNTRKEARKNGRKQCILVDSNGSDEMGSLEINEGCNDYLMDTDHEDSEDQEECEEVGDEKELESDSSPDVEPKPCRSTGRFSAGSNDGNDAKKRRSESSGNRRESVRVLRRSKHVRK